MCVVREVSGDQNVGVKEENMMCVLKGENRDQVVCDVLGVHTCIFSGRQLCASIKTRLSRYVPAMSWKVVWLHCAALVHWGVWTHGKWNLKSSLLCTYVLSVFPSCPGLQLCCSWHCLHWSWSVLVQQWQFPLEHWSHCKSAPRSLIWFPTWITCRAALTYQM